MLKYFALDALKKVLPIVALLHLGTFSIAAGSGETLVLDSDEYHYTASFDPARISKARLRELLVFSPYNLDGPWKIAGYDVQTSFEETRDQLKKGLLPFSLELCVHGNPIYGACGARDISDPNFFENAGINLRRNEQSLKALDSLDVPFELVEVAQQFRQSLEFFTALERNRLQYLQTGDVERLSQPIEGVNPAAECARELSTLTGAHTAQERFQLSLYSWYNCVNSVWLRSSPRYPQNAWDSFLKDYGIRERFEEKPVD